METLLVVSPNLLPAALGQLSKLLKEEDSLAGVLSVPLSFPQNLKNDEYWEVLADMILSALEESGSRKLHFVTSGSGDTGEFFSGSLRVSELFEKAPIFQCFLPGPSETASEDLLVSSTKIAPSDDLDLPVVSVISGINFHHHNPESTELWDRGTKYFCIPKKYLQSSFYLSTTLLKLGRTYHKLEFNCEGMDSNSEEKTIAAINETLAILATAFKYTSPMHLA